MHAHINSLSQRPIPTDTEIFINGTKLTKVTVSWIRKMSIICLRWDLCSSLWRLIVLCCTDVSPFRRDMSLFYLKYVIRFQLLKLCHTLVPNWDTGRFTNTYRTSQPTVAFVHSFCCVLSPLFPTPPQNSNSSKRKLPFFSNLFLP